VLEVRGRHRERYLASQLTSDVRTLAIGDSQLSALLDATGRLQSFFFLNKLDEVIRLLVPAEVAQRTADCLRERVVADDVELVARQHGGMQLVLGPVAVELERDLGSDRVIPIEAFGSRGFVGWDVGDLDLDEIEPAELEARRVLSGLPRWGSEAAAGMLINETSLIDSAVSFTKGCYLGQETVAKLASHRGAAFQPVLLRLDGEVRDPEELVGQRFAAADRERAGTVLSWARWEGSAFLQARLWRELRVDGRELVCGFPDGTNLAATVVSLPLLRPGSPDAMAEDLYLRATTLFAADREDEAIVLLERALVVCPSYPDAYEALGVMLGRHGRFDEAIKIMQRLLEVDPDSVMAHTNMSVYHNQLGRIEEAEREARAAAVKSLERSRRAEAEAESERQQRMREQEDRARREEMFRQVLELDADDALANFGLGQLKVEVGDHAAAVPLLERAIAVDRDYSAAYLALGRALEGLGDVGRALTTYTDGTRVAARRGDLKTANMMQERLSLLDVAEPV